MKKYKFGFSFHSWMDGTRLRFCIWFGNDAQYFQFQYDEVKSVSCGLLSKSSKTPDYMMKIFIGIQYD